ncbi:battenin [Gouania willdenowi]|uniref:battenin n=1 Tax=Gouania willdenowi TaxID=441366 RepID=UPI0010554C63|nr:battenin [Gouania willdenowi]
MEEHEQRIPGVGDSLSRPESSLSGSAGPLGRTAQLRNWAGFWLLGLCNNFAYVVMLSAAHDILTQQQTGNSTVTGPVSSDTKSNSSSYDCNPVSTAAVLLADILPTLFLKALAPFVIHKVPYGVRVLFCVVMAAASFLLVSFSSAMWISIVGVICASVSSGLGELSFLSLSVFFHRDVLGGWGSGTGGAGLAGAFLYSAMVQAGLSPQTTLQFMLVVPAVMLLSYFLLLVPPASVLQWSRRTEEPVSSEERRALMDDEEEEDKPGPGGAEEQRSALTFTEKLLVLRGLLRFLLPLALVYFAEYFINQGLMELLFFPTFLMSHAEQYRWYQTLYQVGVLVSRSSLCCFKIRKIWLLCLLQVLNAIFLLSAVAFQFLPSAWLVFALILYEGLLGGAAYVNTFYFISKETEDRQREFAMAVASVGDSVGIALAGLAAFPVHGYFCSH